LCGASPKKSVQDELNSLFRCYLGDACSKIKAAQDQSVGGIAEHLNNKQMIQFEWLDDELERLRIKFQTEIAMYMDALRISSESNLVESLKTSLFNSKIIAVGALVILAIITLGAFTDAIQSISSWIAGIIR
jgi:hypothetical protein